MHLQPIKVLKYWIALYEVCRGLMKFRTSREQKPDRVVDFGFANAALLEGQVFWP
jgi:hypothetical protein